jgi:hypothetical protein
MNVDIENIGSIEHGIEGRDQYVLMRCDEDTSVDDLQNWLHQRHYRESNRPGGYFCTSVQVVPHPHVGKYIGIICHRYDV